MLPWRVIRGLLHTFDVLAAAPAAAPALALLALLSGFGSATVECLLMNAM